MEEATPLLISSPTPWPEPDCYRSECNLCHIPVYEHRESIEKMKELGGYVLCPFCAIRLKLIAPEKSLPIEAQMWHGDLRVAQVAPSYRPLVDFFNKKD